MIRSSLFVLWLCVASLAVRAQEKFDVKLTGRALIDAAAYSQDEAAKEQDGTMHAGAAVADIRLGMKATYGKWFLRGEVGYANAAISLKDVYLQYNFSKQNSLRVGYFLVPFGLSAAYGTPKKEYMEDPTPNAYLPFRRIGVSHIVYNKPFFAQYGLFADKNAALKSTDKAGKQGFSMVGRFVWRPVMMPDYGFHLGMSGAHFKAESTEEGKHSAVSFSKRYLTYVDRRAATKLNISDATWENRFTLEAQGIYKNIHLVGQYYWSRVGREAGLRYDTKGFYLSARGILLNPASYRYNAASATISHPESGNVEMMLGYGFLDLRDKAAYAKNQAAILAGVGALDLRNAGRMSDYSAGLSYFVNKYVTLRLNYHHIRVENFGLSAKHVNVWQLRAHYLF